MSWLINSSIGRKMIMRISGLFLVLFLLFHSLMNVVVLISAEGYDAIVGFLGANWYALIATVVLASGFIIHIIYAVILTLQNMKARGSLRKCQLPRLPRKLSADGGKVRNQPEHRTSLRKELHSCPLFRICAKRRKKPD